MTRATMESLTRDVATSYFSSLTRSSFPSIDASRSRMYITRKFGFLRLVNQLNFGVNSSQLRVFEILCPLSLFSSGDAYLPGRRFFPCMMLTRRDTCKIWDDRPKDVTHSSCDRTGHPKPVVLVATTPSKILLREYFPSLIMGIYNAVRL